MGGLEDVWGGAGAPLGAYKRRLERSKRTSKTVFNDHRGQKPPKIVFKMGPKRGPKTVWPENAENTKLMHSTQDANGF